MEIQTPMTASNRFQATVALNVRDPKTGRTRSYKKGQVISAAAWAALPSTTRQRFEPVTSKRVSRGGEAAGEKVTDGRVLELFLAAAEAGGQYEGSYAEVWGRLALELNVEAPFAHFRALQISRVGRKFENLVGYSFHYLCPDLAGSDWVTDLVLSLIHI